MRTVTNNLREIASEIQNLLQNLLLNHSSIYMWNTPGGSVAVISVQGNYTYKKLEEEGSKIQAQLLEKYRRFYALITVLLNGQPKNTLKYLSQANTVMMRTIEQNHTWCKNTQEAFNKADQAL